MNDRQLIALARIVTAWGEIKAMEEDNRKRERQDLAPAWDADRFFEALKTIDEASMKEILGR